MGGVVGRGGGAYYYYYYYDYCYSCYYYYYYYFYDDYYYYGEKENLQSREPLASSLRPISCHSYPVEVLRSPRVSFKGVLSKGIPLRGFYKRVSLKG